MTSLVDSHKKRFTVDEILALKPKENNWLWQPFIRKAGLTLLTGPSDCGKSTLMRQLSLAVGAGNNTFLDGQLNTTHSRVCYIATEDDEYGTQEVIKKQLAGLQLETSSIVFLFDNENVSDQLEELLEDTRFDLIVIDGWADTFSGNPNTFVDVRRNLQPLKNLARKHQLAIILLHHNVKNSEKSGPDKNKINGSQGLEATVRGALELRIGSCNDERLLTITKGNYVPAKLKNKGTILKLCPEKLLFSNMQRQKEFSQSDGDRSPKYNREHWLEAYGKHKQADMSIEATRTKLAELYGDEAVPSKTWFVDNLRTDGSSQTVTIESDQPVKITTTIVPKISDNG